MRTLALLLRLPRRLRRRVLGTEWFREVGREPGVPLSEDIFATLRPGTSTTGSLGYLLEMVRMPKALLMEAARAAPPR